MVVTRRALLYFFGVGMIVALHWVTFYGAIKLSNVSVTLGCFATTTLFTSFLEPFFYRKRINFFEVLIGLIIIAGLYLIFRFETRYALGMLVALLSAFLAGLFTVLNKKLVANHRAIQISFYEMIGGLIGLTIFIMGSGRGISTPLLIPTFSDLFYLVLLATVCTAFAMTMQVEVMKHLSAFHGNLIHQPRTGLWYRDGLLYFWRGRKNDNRLLPGYTDHPAFGHRISAFAVLSKKKERKSYSN